jgi:transposase
MVGSLSSTEGACRGSSSIGVRARVDAGGGGQASTDLAQSKVFALRQRAQIVLASDARSPAPHIARVLQTDENQVRQVIREFNADGMASLRPPTGDGRPRRIDDAAREEIHAVALARPGDLGEPGTRWSLTTLRRYLVRHKIVASISKEHLRRVLQSMGLDWGGLRRRSVPDGCDGAPVGGKHV